MGFPGPDAMIKVIGPPVKAWDAAFCPGTFRSDFPACQASALKGTTSLEAVLHSQARHTVAQVSSNG